MYRDNFASEYDGVRYNIPSALKLAYVPVNVDTDIGSATAMLTGRTPGSTI